MGKLSEIEKILNKYLERYVPEFREAVMPEVIQALSLLRSAESEFEEIVAEKKQRDIVIENLKENLRNLDKENEKMREENADLKNCMEAIGKEIKSLIVKNKKVIELAKSAQAALKEGR